MIDIKISQTVAILVDGNNLERSIQETGGNRDKSQLTLTSSSRTIDWKPRV